MAFGKKKEYTIHELNIHNYTTSDAELVLKECKQNKEGFPIVWPTKNNKNQKIVLSFVDAQICDRGLKPIDEEIANFDILEEDVFDSKAKDAATKVKFISALLSPSCIVNGGVYYKGKYFTRKMTLKKALFLMKSFLNKYFRLEDGDFLNEYFLKDGTHLPFWPTKTRDGKKAIFSAVNATISDAKTGETDGNTYNFTMYWGETLDLNKPEDKVKVAVIDGITNSDRMVRGFYYKGGLIEGKLNKNLKLYLEKGFVKRNFTVNQRDYLLSYVSKDPKLNFPIYWPMKDDNNREIVISVVNAMASWIDAKYQNFDVYTDEPFDLNSEDFETKLNIIRAMYYGKNLVSGALYMDGILVNGKIEPREANRRKDKVEKALKIYISDDEDFMTINREFKIEDREQLLNLARVYDKYYPGNKERADSSWDDYKKNPDIVLRFDRTNVINDKGLYVYDKEFSLDLKQEDALSDERALETIKALYNPNFKVRGGLYFKGKNIGRRKPGQLEKFRSEYLVYKLGADVLAKLEEASKLEDKSLRVDKKYKMPYFWPTESRDGREALLSCVDCDVFFKVGRGTVKAVNNATFDIFVGEVFGLVGESGSGKTTISRAILGINKLTKGAIYFKGKAISTKLTKDESLAAKKNIQMIFQDPAASLNERANVDYIISEGLYNFHMFKSKEERLNKVVAMLDAVGLLPEHLSRYPHEFSGGQRQRIGIARALVIEPQLVLADEPISALDVSIRAQVLNLLKKLQHDQGLTYLFIAHDLSIIRYISDRIAVMHQGYIVELGPAEEIYSHPLHPYTRSLLTAIPQPDPKTKDDRKKVPYNKGDIDYAKCIWEECRPGHYVLVNDKLREDIKQRVKKYKK